jgi:hypothetical protein
MKKHTLFILSLLCLWLCSCSNLQKESDQQIRKEKVRERLNFLATTHKLEETIMTAPVDENDLKLQNTQVITSLEEFEELLNAHRSLKGKTIQLESFVISDDSNLGHVVPNYVRPPWDNGGGSAFDDNDPLPPGAVSVFLSMRGGNGVLNSLWQYNFAFNYTNNNGSLQASGLNSWISGFHPTNSWNQHYGNINVVGNTIHFTIHGTLNYNVFIEGIGTVYSQNVVIHGSHTPGTSQDFIHIDYN